MKRAALYVRVSTKEQRDKGMSVDTQIAALTAYCEKEGYHIADIYNDAGLSAHKTYKSRPELLRLIADCNMHKVDVILFTKLDRWFRSIGDFYKVQELLENSGVKWKSILDNHDTETSNGRLYVNFALTLAQDEAEKDSDRIKLVFDHKRDLGEYVGTAPVGYVKKDGKWLVKRADQEAGVDAFFRSYLAYKPLKECITAAMAHGVTITRNTAYRMLRSETYMGNAYGSKCDPYITEDEHKIIEKRLGEYVRSSTLGNEYLFQGLCRCGYCGRQLAASGRKRYSQKRGDYIQKVYQCRKDDYTGNKCEGGGINEDILEKILIDRFEADLEDYNVRARMQNSSDQRLEYAKKKKSLEDKLQRIAEAYEDGIYTREKYLQKKDKVLLDIQSLPLPAEELKEIEVPDDWKDIYNDLTDENKKLFWHRTIKKIIVKNGHNIQIIF